jgi:malate dehydrogenase (oxaloacetate-decarboxylating)
MGAKNLILCDSRGALYEGRERMDPFKQEIARVTNPGKLQGSLADVLAGADVFIGVSAPNIVSLEMASSMNKDAIVFAMANPIPEMHPDIARPQGAKVIGTGRSDFANQVNNVLAFPGVFRGALDVRASDINEAMKVAAVQAIAGLVSAPN